MDGYLLGGHSKGLGSGTAWLVKIDETGTKQWESGYGSTDFDWVNQIITASDGGYILAGMHDWWEGFAVKIDSNGNQEWSQAYLDDPMESGGIEFFDVCTTLDGGYLFGGMGLGGFAVKTDSQGNTINTIK
jgi:hypothetical protein